jgi:cytochrome c oxidase subunit I
MPKASVAAPAGARAGAAPLGADAMGIDALGTDALGPDIFGAGSLGSALRGEVRAWCAIALGSLAIAGVFALLLAISRIPGVETVFAWPLGFFHKGLVIHVVFSFVVWFLAIFGGLLAFATHAVAGPAPRFAGLGRAATAGMAIALPLLFVPALLDRGEATLNNYVPTIIDPMYYGGLLVMAGAMVLAVARLLVNLPGSKATGQPMVLGMVACAAVYLVALVCFAMAYSLLADQAPSYSFNEELFWGGGHVLQFLNTQMLIVAWVVLAGSALAPAASLGRAAMIATFFLAAVALLGPWLYVIYPPFAAEQTLAFTNLQYALGPAAVGVAAVIAARAAKSTIPWREPAFLCLTLSAALFMVGGAFGLFVDGTDTRTPAHYHGVIAAVTLAFMGLFYTLFLPALGRSPAPGKALRSQIVLFAGGQLMACVGLFLAGGFGAPRKTAGADQGLQEIGAVIGMYMNGIGALIAIIGGIMFIWIAAAALLGAPRERKGPIVSPLQP